MPPRPATCTGGATLAAPAARRRPAVALRETAGGYRQHDPRETLLYGLVAEHLEPFLAEVRERYEQGLPDYVEQELLGLPRVRHPRLRVRAGALPRMRS